MHFKIKKNTPLRKLMNAYCERQGFQKPSIRFVFDGAQVGEDQTPTDVSGTHPLINITIITLIN